MELNKEQAIDILEKFDFFQGQRAGRELWNSKPFVVQEQDISNFSRDVALLKDYIKEITEKVEELEEDNFELQAIVDLRNKRKWYTKFVKEVFQVERKDTLLYPDFDYIYERWFKLKEEYDKNDSEWRELWENSQRKWEEAYEKLEEENERLFDECGKQSVLWKQHFESIYETAKETVKADTARKIFEDLESVIVGNQYGEAKILVTEYLKRKKKYSESEVAK